MKIIITIPAYNEEKTLPRVIEEIKEVMSLYNYEYEILVLNDGSKDRTEKVAKKHGAVVVSNKRNLGLAETFKREMKECLRRKADIIVHTDADGQYPAKYIPFLIKKVKHGYDLVLGTRFGKGRYENESFMKKIGNRAFALVFSNLLKQRISDTTTGFRAFTSEVAQLPLINYFTYTQEQILRAGRRKMRIGHVPIKARKTRNSRLFKNPFEYALKAWINIFRIYRDYEPLAFFGKVGLFFFSAGFGIGIWLLYRFITLGYVGRIPSQILSVLLMLAGVQIILFGFLADMMKK